MENMQNQNGTEQYKQYTPKNRTKVPKGVKIFGIIIIVFVAILILVNLVSPSSYQYSSANAGSVRDEHIAVLYLEGTIENGSPVISQSGSGYNQNWMLNTIYELMENDRNKGIVMYLNTPGGSVYATDEIYLALKEYKDVTGNPVYAAMGPTAASGGYYIACIADKIYANRNTMTGSIGVIMGDFYDISQFLEDWGIQAESITSGRNKGMGSYTEPMTQEQREILQSIVDESYGQFLDVVMKGRNMDVNTLKPLADGRIYSAQQALDAGLIDGIATLEDTIYKMIGDYQLRNCAIYDYYYTYSGGLWSWIFGKIDIEGISQRNNEFQSVMEMIENNTLTEPYYLAY